MLYFFFLSLTNSTRCPRRDSTTRRTVDVLVRKIVWWARFDGTIWPRQIEWTIYRCNIIPGMSFSFLILFLVLLLIVQMCSYITFVFVAISTIGVITNINNVFFSVCHLSVWPFAASISIIPSSSKTATTVVPDKFNYFKQTWNVPSITDVLMYL